MPSHLRVIFHLLVAGNITTMTTLDAETKTSYWLTVFAQDHGVVPLHSVLHVSNLFHNNYSKILLHFTCSARGSRVFSNSLFLRVNLSFYFRLHGSEFKIDSRYREFFEPLEAVRGLSETRASHGQSPYSFPILQILNNSTFYSIYYRNLLPCEYGLIYL